MGCDTPITAYRSQDFNPATGKYGITFSRKEALNPASISGSFKVPCGKCQGCLLERSRQVSVRCMHEAQMQPENCFLTLTYSESQLPVDYSVNKLDPQLFLKRLRDFVAHTATTTIEETGEVVPRRFKFYGCGEYGEKSYRPHYHILIFGYDFPDKVLFETTPQGHKLYVSERLHKLWPFGLCTIGALTYQTASYTARYTMKKLDGMNRRDSDYYLRVHPQHGFICRVQPEFSMTSRGGRTGKGLGYGWYEKFGKETFAHDSVIVEGYEAQPPRYYFNQLNKEEQQAVVDRRRKNIQKLNRERDNTFNTHDARVTVRDSKMSTLKRKL